MTYTFAICLIIVAQVGLAAIAIPVFRSVWKGDSFLRRLAQNMLLAFFALLFTLTVVEVACKFLFVQSDGINFTLASRSWFERYWQPINSLGYRRRLPPLKALWLSVISAPLICSLTMKWLISE